MQPIVWFGFWFLGLVAAAEPQRNLFRTELFPEQLQQQQLQFRQRVLQVIVTFFYLHTFISVRVKSCNRISTYFYRAYFLGKFSLLRM